MCVLFPTVTTLCNKLTAFASHVTAIPEDLWTEETNAFLSFRHQRWECAANGTQQYTPENNLAQLRQTCHIWTTA